MGSGSEETTRRQAHLLTLADLPTLVEVVREYGVDRARAGRMALVLLSSLPGAPFRWIDRAVSARRVARTPLPRRPLFVLGFWRTGTTHLHNLLSSDPRLGCVRAIHCVASGSFLGPRRLSGALLRPFLPDRRPMDEVRFGLDQPQEEEFAMARMSTMSQFHCFTAPRSMRATFDRWVTFRTASPADVADWKELYGWFLRRVSLDEGGRPLCLKSPGHMGRLPVLRSLFPDARFIHIHRNPHVVYHSNLDMWRTMIRHSTLHAWDVDQPERERALEENLVYFYRELHERFFRDSADLPSDRLAEVRFEDLERDPLGELERLYGQLDLPGWEAASKGIAHHLEQTRGYRRNAYVFDEPSMRRVEDAWGFALERFGYGRPTDGPGRPREGLGSRSAGDPS